MAAHVFRPVFRWELSSQVTSTHQAGPSKPGGYLLWKMVFGELLESAKNGNIGRVRTILTLYPNFPIVNFENEVSLEIGKNVFF